MSQTVEMERLETRVESILDHLELFLPIDLSLPDLAARVGKSPDTLRKHLYTHYRENIDYKQPKKNGKIYVARHAALAIKEKYAK